MALTDDITDPRLAKALAHPLRLEILRHLGDRTASPSEIATEIGAPLTNVSYHVRKLRALGLIKLVRKTPKRGVIEHYYSAKPRRTVTDEAWAATPDIVKEALVVPVAEGGSEAMVRAAAGGGFNRHNAHLLDQTRTLDERGWNDISKLLHKTYDEIVRIESESVARIESEGNPSPIKAGFVIGFFEAVGKAPTSDSDPAPARKRSTKRPAKATS